MSTFPHWGRGTATPRTSAMTAEPQFLHEKMSAFELIQLCGELRELLKRSEEKIELTEAVLAEKLGVASTTKPAAGATLTGLGNDVSFLWPQPAKPDSPSG